ncbi:MAG: hypothetical protein OXC46_07350 [Thaumarchaeota archaeon]|nr:hypothetical protein [Nitrososphaerota archaeon]
MAKSEKIQGNNTYVTYIYRDGNKHVGIYCGKKGKASTMKKLRQARQQHYKVRLKRIQEKYQ